MLKIVIPKQELFNNQTSEFIYIKEQTIQLEHSLVSISKWESKWLKPYFSKNKKTREELIDYIRCMTISQNIDPNVYYGLTEENYSLITKYIESPMTATVINDDGFDNKNAKKNKTFITSELIYYWMISLNIPIEFQKWHINRLLTLIRVCQIKNSPDNKKRSKSEVAKYYSELNKKRRKELNSSG